MPIPAGSYDQAAQLLTVDRPDTRFGEEAGAPRRATPTSFMQRAAPWGLLPV